MTDEKKNYPRNDEFLGQTNENIFVIAQATVNLAVSVLLNEMNVNVVPTQVVQDLAFAAIMKYADWPKIPLPYDIKRRCYEENYDGEGEIWMQREEAKRGTTLVMAQVLVSNSGHFVDIVTLEKNGTQFTAIMGPYDEAEASRICNEAKAIYGPEPIVP